LVKEAKPVLVEMVVRGYLTGSMWRGYKEGQRTFSGTTVPDGLTQNQRFEEPLITPTTKDEDDSPIDEAGIIEAGLVTKALFQEMKTKAIELFKFGTEYLEERGIVLVDTKYEFGILDGKLILIDEMHTPDSSRFWGVEDYKKSALDVEQIDKEFVRQWMLANKVDGQVPTVLSTDVVVETARRYQEIYEVITGQPFIVDSVPVDVRMYHNLLKAGVLKAGYVAILGEREGESIIEILNVLAHYEIAAHVIPEDVLVPELAYIFNYALEPVVVLAREGQDEFIEDLCVPVINLEGGIPFEIVDAALRSLNIRSVRSRMYEDLSEPI
jgi:phosphoribosylaminoimidazole-succinocarboxamide synthase